MEVECHFGVTLWLYLRKTGYSCFVNSATVTKPNTMIRSISGTHIDGKSNNDVLGLEFHDSNLHYFPRGLSKIFPNLKFLSVNNCGLKSITRDDFAGLEQISKLRMDRNQLKTLPDDLFSGMKNLQAISFRDNKLENFSSKLLTPILKNNLLYVSFLENPNIDVAFSSEIKEKTQPYTDLPTLMQIIDKFGKKPQKDQHFEIDNFNSTISRGFHELWTSGRFSDFTIASASHKFPVHKSVLAIQSSYFAKLFTKDWDDDKILKLDEYSAEAVEEVLRYIYTGKIPDETHAIEIFALTSKWKISALSSIFEKTILKNLDITNALKIFELGHRWESADMKKLAFEEIKVILGENDLSIDLMNNLEEVKKLVEVKSSYEFMLKSFKNK